MQARRASSRGESYVDGFYDGLGLLGPWSEGWTLLNKIDKNVLATTCVSSNDYTGEVRASHKEPRLLELLGSNENYQGEE